MSKLEFYLNKIVKCGLYAILLTPLAFWPKALYPFATPKFLLFQVLVEIVFGAWLILRLLRFNLNNNLNNFPRLNLNNWLVITLTSFIAISFVSALLGVDFSRSFWGLGPRMTGLFAELHFLAWFLVLISFIKVPFGKTSDVLQTSDVKENGTLTWQKYLNFSFVISLIVAATAFYQNPKWAMSLGYGVFNNPTFVGPYLIFHFFWGIYQAFQFTKPDSRGPTSRSPEVGPRALKWWFFAAGTIFLLAMILFAQIRGVILGLILGVLVLGLGLIFSNVLNRRWRSLLVTCYLLLVTGLACFWFLRDNETVQKFSPIRRVTGISLSETTVQTRLLAWKTALEGYKDAVWFGVGPENFNFLFNAHYHPRFLKLGSGGFGETWFDKPHNAFLEVLTETGIIGIAAYFLIWIVIFFVLIRLWRSKEKLLSLSLASAFIAYFGAVFFSFDSFGSWFGLYLFLAFLASHNNMNLQIYPNSANINSPLKKLFVVFVCISILGLLGVNLSIWRANLADAEALRVFPRNPTQAVDLFKKSFGYFSPYKTEYQFDFLSSVVGAFQKGISFPGLEDTLNFALEQADAAVVAHPKNAAYYTDLAKIYGILASKSRDVWLLTQAENFGRKSLELSPNRQETLYYLSQNAAFRGDSKMSIEWGKQAVDAEPAIKQSHWYLGLAYLAANQKEEGILEIKKALELGYGPRNEAEKEFLRQLGL